MTLSCPASSGGAVAWMVTGVGGAIGRNSSRGGVSWNPPPPQPHVFIRSDVFGNIPSAVQLYIVVHECAHFLLPAGASEYDADCWTVRTLLQNRWLSVQNLEYVRTKLLVPREVGDWGHPGSLIHAEHIPRCLAALR